jgi:hypothetical protein
VLVLVSVLVLPPSGGLLLLIYRRSAVPPEQTEPDRTSQQRQYRDSPRIAPSTISKSSSHPDVRRLYPLTETSIAFSSRCRYHPQYSGLDPGAAHYLFHQLVGHNLCNLTSRVLLSGVLSFSDCKSQRAHVHRVFTPCQNDEGMAVERAWSKISPGLKGNMELPTITAKTASNRRRRLER